MSSTAAYLRLYSGLTCDISKLTAWNFPTSYPTDFTQTGCPPRQALVDLASHPPPSLSLSLHVVTPLDSETQPCFHTYSMNPPRKKFFGLLRRSRSNLPVDSGTSEIEASSLLPSRDGSLSRRGFSVLRVPKFWGKRSSRSARQSPNPEPAAASSSAPDLLPAQTSQDPSLLTSPTLTLTPTPTPEPNPDQPYNSGIPKAEQPDPKSVNERIIDATKGVAGMKNVPVMAQNAASQTNNLQSIPDTIDTFSAILKPLKAFNSIANVLADVHPYAKVALSIFTYASQIILDQADRDAAVSALLLKISEVYNFITEDEVLATIPSMPAIYGKIARQTLECADFITHYSETTSAWQRLGKHVFDETNGTVQNYSNALDSLMQQFRDRAARDTVVIVHRMAETLDLISMNCAEGAGVNTSKCCLPNTRQEVLMEIKSWISSTDEGTPRIFWLSGTAGKGKSAIAHTIANWYTESGGLCSCFCFDRTQQTDRRVKIFTTIANDLADCNPIVRRALTQALHDNNGLKRTSDLTRQWQELVVGPTSKASEAIAAPVLIVIEALDESGEASSREQILRLLGGKLNASPSQLTELPANFRILVTSRPLEDISKALHAAPHVRHISLDDVSSASAEHDIQLYITNRLEDLRNVFNDEHFKRLALKSDGMFEWARLICEYIKGTNRVGLDPQEKFKAVVAGTSKKGTRLLDDMYARILEETLPEDERGEAIPVFRSVMGQIVASLEPLAMTALTAMRLHFSPACRYKVERVIGPLGSLLAGTIDSQTPIRPLHASFYDFLTDRSRSHDFFIDASSVQRDLAFASLRIMERGLRFNICSLESSYLPNSAVPDLEKRVEQSIPTVLSYSCRFWGTHLGATSFEPSLAKEIAAFFDGERLLWWLEALCLLKSLGDSVGCLSSITHWFKDHAEYAHVDDISRDAQRFVRNFGAAMLHSTPHLYLSALPFAPTQSKIFKKFAAKFPSTPRIAAGHVANWPLLEKILHGHTLVTSVAMSPDGKRIVCGSFNGTIQMWDIETGEPLGVPLHGHTERVVSIAFSPDGKRIVSGSWDATVRVWDAATGRALGAPLQGHTGAVMSVAISSDGNHIVSGSWDKTIRVWDAETRMELGFPLRGHTSGVSSVVILPDGKRIVSGSYDKTIQVWDLETGQAFGAPFQGHTGAILSVAISPDGNRIVSGADDMTIRVWAIETGEALGSPLQGHTNWVLSVAISSDGNRIVSGSSDMTIRVWDMESRKALGSPLQGHANYVMSVIISPDGNRLVSGSYDKTIRVWNADASTSEALRTALHGHTATINSLVISPNGHHIVSGSDDKTIRVWDIETGEALGAPLRGHTDSVQSVAISPDGHCIVSGSSDKTVRMWDMETGKALGSPLQGHTDWVRSVAISQDGRSIVSGSDDRTVRVWEAQTGVASGAPLQGHSGCVLSVTISPDGNRILSGSRDDTIQVWDMGSGSALSAPLRGHTNVVCSVAISSDGHRIVSGSCDKTIWVWDMGTGETLGAALQGHSDSIFSVVISSDRNHIVSGSDDRTIRVWDMETGKAVGAPLRGHSGPVLCVAISPNGKHVVSGSSDATIRVWDLDILNRDQPFEAPAICFSSNQTHALHSPSSFLQHSYTPASLALTEEGWVIGPDGRLLFWIPVHLYPAMHFPGNTLVIHNQASQLDLSCFAHGMSWHKCREQKVA